MTRAFIVIEPFCLKNKKYILEVLIIKLLAHMLNIIVLFYKIGIKNNS